MCLYHVPTGFPESKKASGRFMEMAPGRPSAALLLPLTNTPSEGKFDGFAVHCHLTQEWGRIGSEPARIGISFVHPCAQREEMPHGQDLSPFLAMCFVHHKPLPSFKCCFSST